MNSCLLNIGGVAVRQQAGQWLERWVNPAQFDFWAQRLDRSWAWRRTLARVVERRVEAAGTVTLELQANGNFRGFAPGQHLNVTPTIGGLRHTRSYSPSAPWSGNGRVCITVQQRDEGFVSKHLCTELQVGDVLELGEAFGEMVLPEPLPQRLLLVAGGSGITPLICMVRALAAQGMPVEVTLLAWARHREALCFTEELRELARVSANFRVVFALSREAGVAEDEIGGRPDVALLGALVPDLGERAVYACGGAGFTAAVAAACRAIAPEVAFSAESFTPPEITSTDVGTVRVTLARSGRELELPRGQSLLQGLEVAGVNPPSGCRMGICKTCACGKVRGATRNLNDGSIDAEADEHLRLCVSSAVSDLTLDI